MKRWWWWAAALTALLVSGRADALSISLVTATPVIGIGQIAFVDVFVADLPEGQALRAFDLEVVFGAPPLAYASLAFDGFLGQPPAEAITGSGPIVSGRVEIAATSLLPSDALLELQPDAFRPARIGLLGVELGIAALAFGPAELIGLGGLPLSATGSSGVSIEVVRETSTTLLLVSGLAGLAIGRARRRRGRDAHGPSPLPPRAGGRGDE